MKPSPTVAVVTRTRDRLVLLKRAIESVLGQTYPHWRMVIVNDGGSTQPVDELLERFEADACGRIKVIHNDLPRGMHGASAVGIEQAEGELVTIHDDDDSWAPEFLTIAISALLHAQRDFPSVRGVTTYCNRVFERLHGNLIEIETVESFNGSVPSGMLSLDKMLSGNFVPPISFLFERSALNEVGGLYEEIPYLGDWDFLVRFLSRFDIHMVPQHLAFWHWRRDSEAPVGNSVVAEVERHHFFHRLLLNRWLRADLAAGRFGVGAYANLRAFLETAASKLPD